MVFFCSKTPTFVSQMGHAFSVNHKFTSQKDLLLAPLFGPFMVHFIKYPATAGYFLQPIGALAPHKHT
jgi:hypothetical protein